LFLSHDWPKNIALYGNTNKLLEEKQFLRDNIENGTLGSPASTRILSLAKPNYWFSAHMHVKYAALYPHS
jgi:lariat debranching enzyme